MYLFFLIFNKPQRVVPCKILLHVFFIFAEHLVPINCIMVQCLVMKRDLVTERIVCAGTR